MKTAILGDLHWGARNDSEVMQEHFLTFFREVFFPSCREHGVKRVIQLGDLMDRRKYVNFVTLAKAKEFVEMLESSGMKMWVLLGNHDIYYRNTLQVNSIDLLFQSTESLVPVREPTEEGDFLMVPWICEENREAVEASVSVSRAKYCAGHFEFAGFPLYRGIACEHGDDHREFFKFDHVYSGHFHTRSSVDNVTYVGTPYDITWSDYGDKKGFLILDTETGSETWIDNPFSIHRKFFWVPGMKLPPADEVTEKHVKLVIDDDGAPEEIEAYVSGLAAMSPTTLVTVDNRSAEFDDNFEGFAEKDPVAALRDEISATMDGETRDRVLTKLADVYDGAISISGDDR